MPDNLQSDYDNPWDAYRKGRETERAAIVAWLREQAICGCGGKYGACDLDDPPLAYAKEIECGDHLPSNGASNA